MFLRLRLGKGDSARGASIGTCATLRAFVGIDAIDIAFRDSANGAFINASAASNAVFTNYVSHSSLVLSLMFIVYSLMMNEFVLHEVYSSKVFSSFNQPYTLYFVEFRLQS